jgi:hypothetical protein
MASTAIPYIRGPETSIEDLMKAVQDQKRFFVELRVELEKVKVEQARQAQTMNQILLLQHELRNLKATQKVVELAVEPDVEAEVEVPPPSPCVPPSEVQKKKRQEIADHLELNQVVVKKEKPLSEIDQNQQKSKKRSEVKPTSSTGESQPQNRKRKTEEPPGEERKFLSSRSSLG